MAKRTKADCYDAFIEEVTEPWEWTGSFLGWKTKGGVMVNLKDRSYRGDCKITLDSIVGRGPSVVAALRRITSVADKHGVTLTLTAMPLGGGEYQKPVRYLESLYEKFGFESKDPKFFEWGGAEDPRGSFQGPDAWDRWSEEYEEEYGVYPDEDDFDEDEWEEIQEEFYEWATENSDEEWRFIYGRAEYLSSIPMVRKPAKKRRRRR